MGTWVLVLVLLGPLGGPSMTNVFGFADVQACTLEGQRWANRNRMSHRYHCLEVKGNGEG